MQVDYWRDFNDLWEYGDPAGTEQRFRILLPAAEQHADRNYYLELLTQLARTLSLQGNFDDAHAVLDRVKTEMEADNIVTVRYLLERGRTINSAGEPARALPLFQDAAELAEKIGAHFFAVDALHMVAIAAPAAEQLNWNLQAIDYAERCGDERAYGWMGSLYNNTAWALFEAARYTEALDLFQQAERFRARQGNEEALRIARWCVAKTLRVLDRTEEALAIQRDLEANGEEDGFVAEEIAECLLALGDAEAARHYFAEALAALSQIDWVAEDTARIEHLRQLAEGCA
jgi:tetratricopeptide (TPR) repeat protein